MDHVWFPARGLYYLGFESEANSSWGWSGCHPSKSKISYVRINQPVLNLTMSWLLQLQGEGLHCSMSLDDRLQKQRNWIELLMSVACQKRLLYWWSGVVHNASVGQLSCMMHAARLVTVSSTSRQLETAFWQISCQHCSATNVRQALNSLSRLDHYCCIISSVSPASRNGWCQDLHWRILPLVVPSNAQRSRSRASTQAAARGVDGQGSARRNQDFSAWKGATFSIERSTIEFANQEGLVGVSTCRFSNESLNAALARLHLSLCWSSILNDASRCVPQGYILHTP